jgi:putative ribosome biogenesis GTPase RsgA
MGGVSWSTHKQLQDKSKKQENQITDLEKENEELKRRYEERLKEIQIQKELKEKQEREIQNKKIAALEDMTNSLKKIEEQELEAAEKELNNISIQWCVEEIKEIDLEKILKNCYETLIKFENLEITIKENVKQLIKELIKKNEIKHLNLQVIGKTGVGKSTLLNAIFGENVAEEKKGEPCTMETKCYESQKYNFIRIYDTRGIEISKNFDIDKVFKETLKEIKAKCEKNEPDDLIHCLLYCFTGTRFEKEEGEILVKLRKTYEGKKLPIILVLTQDIGEDDEEDNKEGDKGLFEAINKIIEDKCDERISDKPQSISYVEVLAKAKKIHKFKIPPKGLDILIQKCLEKGEYASKFACLSAIKISGEKKIKEDYLKIRKDILIEKDRFFDILFQKQMFGNIFEDIIEKVFITFSLMTNRELVSRDTFEYVKTVNQKIIKLILDVEDKKFRDFIDNKTNYIANMLMNEQTSVGKKYDFGFGNSIKDSNEFAFIISLKLKQKLKIISEINAIKNAAQIISLTIIDTFMSLFIDSYLKEIQSDDIKTYLENSVNGCLSEELKNKIQTLIEDLKKYQKEESNN